MSAVVCLHAGTVELGVKSLTPSPGAMGTGARALPEAGGSGLALTAALPEPDALDPPPLLPQPAATRTEHETNSNVHARDTLGRWHVWRGGVKRAQCPSSRPGTRSFRLSCPRSRDVGAASRHAAVGPI